MNQKLGTLLDTTRRSSYALLPTTPNAEYFRWLTSPDFQHVASDSSPSPPSAHTVLVIDAQSLRHRGSPLEDVPLTTVTTAHQESDSAIIQKADYEQGLMSEVASRADVFAGVVIFSIGMLVLIVAMIFYFVNGRFCRSIRGNRQRETVVGKDLESNRPSDGEREGVQFTGVIVSSSVVETDKDCADRDNVKRVVAEPHGDGEISKESEHSPSTARLDNPPANKSVFAFLKGPFNNNQCHPSGHRQNTSSNHNHSGSNNSNQSTNNSSGMDMPALTRTKARSSVTHKPGRFSHSRPNNNNNPGRGALSINIQELNRAHFPTTATTTTAIAATDNAAPISDPSTNIAGTPHPGINPKTDIWSSSPHSRTPSRSSYSTAPTLLRLDMNAPRSSSIMGLYGSARSSPNGSLADAASVRAIYCHSLKSALSYTTHAESALGLECQDAVESKEVVLATTGMERQH